MDFYVNTFSFIISILSMSRLVFNLKNVESEDANQKDLRKCETELMNSPKKFNVSDGGSQTIVFKRKVFPRALLENLDKLNNSNNSFDRFISHTADSVIVTEKLSNEITYRLYNQKCVTGEYLRYNSSTRNKNWIPGSDVVFIIHGWWQSGSGRDIVSDIFVGTTLLPAFRTPLIIKDAYIESNRTENIVIVNWRPYSQKFCYPISAEDTKKVGESLAHMVVYLRRLYFRSYSQVKMVGFSLGAHVAGIAGHFIQTKLNGRQIGEIIGLDPAGLFFDPNASPLDPVAQICFFPDDLHHLDINDAQFVQVMHCNMGKVFWPFDIHFGTRSADAHINFYINGGHDQPRCPLIPLIKDGCSHLRCGELYAATVRGNLYKGCACDSTRLSRRKRCSSCQCSGPSMGYHCPQNVTGEYCITAIPRMLFA